MKQRCLFFLFSCAETFSFAPVLVGWFSEVRPCLHWPSSTHRSSLFLSTVRVTIYIHHQVLTPPFSFVSSLFQEEGGHQGHNSTKGVKKDATRDIIAILNIYLTEVACSCDCVFLFLLLIECRTHLNTRGFYVEIHFCRWMLNDAASR